MAEKARQQEQGSTAGSNRNGDWRPVRRLRTHEHVLAAVEEQILSGRLKPGDKLPGERELSDLLEVSRPSVREALRALESLGIVRAGVGSGKNAGSTIADEPSIALSYFLRVHVGLANFKFTDVLKTRIALERGAAEGAAENAKKEDIEFLRKLVGDMEADAVSPAAYHDRDTEFHVAIGQASGNQMLAEFMEAVRDAIRQQMVAATVTFEDWDDVARKLSRQHGKIVDAIEAKQAEKAGKLVVTHITGFYKRAGFIS